MARLKLKNPTKWAFFALAECWMTVPRIAQYDTIAVKRLLKEKRQKILAIREVYTAHNHYPGLFSSSFCLYQLYLHRAQYRNITESIEDGEFLVKDSGFILDNKSQALREFPQYKVAIYCSNLTGRLMYSSSKYRLTGTEAHINEIRQAISNAEQIRGYVYDKRVAFGRIEREQSITLLEALFGDAYIRLALAVDGKEKIEAFQLARECIGRASQTFLVKRNRDEIKKLAFLDLLVRCSLARASEDYLELKSLLDELERHDLLSHPDSLADQSIVMDCAVDICTHLLEKEPRESRYALLSEKFLLDILGRNSNVVSISLPAIEKLSRVFLSQERWRDVVSAATHVLENPAKLIDTNLDRPDLIQNLLFLQNLGDIASCAAVQLKEPLNGLLLAEAGRSLGWKYALSQSVPVETTFDPDEINLPQEFYGRITVSISICEIGMCWIFLYPVGDDEFNVLGKGGRQFDRADFVELLTKSDGWIDQYVAYCQSQDSFDAGVKYDGLRRWDEYVGETLEWLWNNVAKNVHDTLLEIGVEAPANLHIIWSGIASVLPIAAAGYRRLDGSWYCWGDDWNITISDSMRHSFHFAGLPNGDTNHQGKRGSWLGVTDPRLDLQLPCNPVLKHGGPIGTDLIGDEATLARVLDQMPRARFISFLTHGIWSPIDPEGSGLLLAQGEMLTLRELQEVQLQAGSVVLLGACESGISDWGRRPAEGRGLPAAFLWAGAQSVLAAHWPVHLGPTDVLFERLASSVQENPGRASDHFSALGRLMRKRAGPFGGKAPSFDKCGAHLRGDEGRQCGSSVPGTNISERTIDDLENFVCDFSRPIHWAAFSMHQR